jgi:hypothetical protein
MVFLVLVMIDDQGIMRSRQIHSSVFVMLKQMVYVIATVLKTINGYLTYGYISLPEIVACVNSYDGAGTDNVLHSYSEVLGSSLLRYTGCPDRFSVPVSVIPPTSFRLRLLLPDPVQFIRCCISLITT